MKIGTKFGLGALLVLLSVGGARADILAPWTYSWDTDPLSVPSDGGAMTGGINLTALPLAPGATMSGSADLSAVDLSTFSDAPTGTSDTFNQAPYALVLHLTDVTSGQSGDLTFKGQFDGTLSTTSAQVGNTFLDPTTQRLVLGGRTYTVVLHSYVAPGLPTATVLGRIGAHVSITDPAPPPAAVPAAAQDVPEPSALLLAGLTLPAVGLLWHRGRGARSRGARAG